MLVAGPVGSGDEGEEWVHPAGAGVVPDVDGLHGAAAAVFGVGVDDIGGGEG